MSDKIKTGMYIERALHATAKAVAAQLEIPVEQLYAEALATHLAIHLGGKSKHLSPAALRFSRAADRIIRCGQPWDKVIDSLTDTMETLAKVAEGPPLTSQRIELLPARDRR